MIPKLRLVVFDLDFCVWHPEMYQIQGPPMLNSLQKLKHGVKQPRKRKSTTQKKNPSLLQLPKKPTTNRKGMIVTDRDGTPITVFDGASHALSEINQWKKEQRNDAKISEDANAEPIIQTAVASCTDKPSFARQCMEWLIISDGTTLSACFDHVCIQHGDKRAHFESLHRITRIPYNEMCFFDDWDVNIESVRTLGVHCVHTPNGMTPEAWEEALNVFDLN